MSLPECTICGHRKKPWGRSAPMGATFCDHECPGYFQHPTPETLWPDEKPVSSLFADDGEASQSRSHDEERK